MAHCHNCDGHVSKQFTRVFGDNEDTVYGCRRCVDAVELFDGVESRRSVEAEFESGDTGETDGDALA